MKFVFVAVLLNAIFLGESIVVRDFDNTVYCTVRVSRMEHRMTPYKETFRARTWGIFFETRTRVNYRSVANRTWAIEKMCCSGYRKIYNVCRPVCSKRCMNGNCVSPNVCECNQGFFKSSSVDEWNICQPLCDSDCKNGFCAARNTCFCNAGYKFVNDSLHCVPICKENCEENNATCVAPNTCACNPGYERIEDSNKCRPTCNQPCVNGQCTEVETCTCNVGFQLNHYNAYLCDPKCEHGCSFGTCTAPNTCTCDPGYRLKNDSVCEPVCNNTCEMGTCIAPETCSCYDGYGLLENSSHVCIPICEMGCINGSCSSPGVCVCNEGYWFNGPEEERHVCRPFCKIPCEPYGFCTAPNVCDCMEGYRMIDFSTMDNEIPTNSTEIFSACEPVCTEGCIHGKCIEPDVCNCSPGYRQSTNSSNICQPVCEPLCISNSVCTEPNVCTCLAGYQRVQNDVTNSCEPICETHCGRNSSCTAPNVCTCDEGFAKDLKNQCTPVCAATCINSTCVGPNVCQCLEGFSQQNETICVPSCENCENGECIGPNECIYGSDKVIDRENGNSTDFCTRNCSGHGVCIDEKQSCNCSLGWMGWDCDQPTICIFLMPFEEDYDDLSRFILYTETNSTLMNARDNAPYCYSCNQSMSNETVCFPIPSNVTTTVVGCFVDSESPCYMMHQQTKSVVLTIVSTLALITILIMVAATSTACFMFRRQQKRKLLPGVEK